MSTPNSLSNELTFTTAARAARVPKIALSGASGAGKTLSALMLAGGLVDAPMLPEAPATGKWSDIIVADTENGSSQLYAGLAFNYKNYRGEIATVEIGPFTHFDFKPPFEWRRWVKLIEDASKRGKCLILDTVSAEWSGQGGILDFVGSLGGRATDWKSGSAAHRTVLDAILRAPIPIIALLREDQKHEIVRVPNGSGGEKVQVNKLGLKPQQREGFEYEVDLALTIDHNTHIASVGTGKDRTGLFDGRSPFLITPAVGAELALWANEGQSTQPAAVAGEVVHPEMAAIFHWIERIDSTHAGTEEQLDAVRTEMNATLKKRTKMQGEALRRAIETARAAIHGRAERAPATVRTEEGEADPADLPPIESVNGRAERPRGVEGYAND